MELRVKTDFGKATVFLLYILAAWMLRISEASNPIKTSQDYAEDVFDINSQLQKPSTVVSSVSAPIKNSLVAVEKTKSSPDELLPVYQDSNPSASNEEVIQRSQLVKLSSSTSSDDILSQDFNVESRWFPRESYAGKLEKLGLLAEAVKRKITDEKFSVIRRLNALLPHVLRFDNVKEIQSGSNKIKRGTDEGKTRMKRSWGDFWYDYSDYDLDYCDEPPCPIWSEWHGTGLCNATCGGGKRLLVRYCNNSKTDEFQGGCEGDSTKLEDCNLQHCPSWTDWASSGHCSATCGKGYMKYTRACTINGDKALGCIGANTEFQICSTNGSCPPRWTNWSPFGPCSKTCGIGGFQIRRRLCIVTGKPVKGKKTPCNGYPVQQRRCSVKTRCQPRFSYWTPWSHCDAVTCGASGFQTRTRSCLGVDGNVLSKYRMNCKAGQLIEQRDCRAQSCAKACTIVVADFANNTSPTQIYSTPRPTWSQWTEWNACSVTCGLGGRQTRGRMCFGVRIELSNNTVVLEEDKTCAGKPIETRSCHYNVGCPHWDGWQKWGACSRTCGSGGRRRRRRKCTVEIYDRFNVGEELESTKILEKIDVRQESEDGSGEGSAEGSGVEREWENLPKTSMYSGGSDLYRKKRKLLRTDFLNDHWCEGGFNFSTGIATCNEHPCPPRWSRWQAWSECSVTCGKGQVQRARRCIGNGNCHGEKFAFRSCYKSPCWAEWSPYTPCTKSCGSGIRVRSRKCRGTTPEMPQFRDCEGPELEKITCNSQGCPKWGEWTAWGNCSAPCDGGSMLRTRECVQGVCRGINHDIASCNYQPCPYWGQWSTFSCCSVTCGDGIKTRTRRCRHGTPGVPGCKGSVTNTQPCNPNACNIPDDTQLNSSQCGVKPENITTKFVLKIFNGRVSNDHEWPWQASWQHHTCIAGVYDCKWEHLCGATLVGSKWVVTAGHCIEEWVYRVVHDDPGDKWSVVIGMTKLYKTGDRYYIRRVLLHPEYEYKGVPRNDIALLKLRQPVPVTDFAMPACLPERHIPHQSKKCFVTGWGNTHPRSVLSPHLRHADLPVLEFKDCQKLGDIYNTYLNEDWHLCAGDIENPNAADSCRGDSGGPMVCVRPDGKWYLAGITSFGFKECGTAGHAGIYAPMNEYEEWMRETIENYSHNGC